MITFRFESVTVDGYSELLEIDAIHIARRIPASLLPTITDYGAFIAGGFIRAVIAREEINDLDLFAPNKEVAKMIAVMGGGNKFHETDNAFTFNVDGLTVQVIHRWTFGNPIDCVRSFDFTIACAAVMLRNLSDRHYGVSSVCDPRFYPDLAGKRLTYRSPVRDEEAGGSMLRVLKFYQRGYRIPLADLAAVIGRLVNGVDFEKVGFTRGSSEYEKNVSAVVAGLLYEVDPNAVSWKVAQGE